MKTKIMFGILAFLMLAMPFAAAQEAAAAEAAEIKGGQEYPIMQRAIDRIKLAFTLQIERKLELMNKIQERRQQHYDFLAAKGKTEQAEKFNAKTIGLVKNFEQWKANKQDIIAKIEQNKTSVKSSNKTAAKPAEIQKQSGGKK